MNEEAIEFQTVRDLLNSLRHHLLQILSECNSRTQKTHTRNSASFTHWAHSKLRKVKRNGHKSVKKHFFFFSFCVHWARISVLISPLARVSLFIHYLYSENEHEKRHFAVREANQNGNRKLNCPVFFSFLSDFFVFIVVIFSIEMSSIELVVLLVY